MTLLKSTLKSDIFTNMKCVKCKSDIPEGRLKALPNAKTCVNCSGAKMKGAVTVMKGTGDHTWVETVHLEADEFEQYMEQEKKYKKSKGE